MEDILQLAKEKFKEIILEKELYYQDVIVTARGLSAQEAIGNPERKDFPILQGKEVMIEAEFSGSFGQAFTDSPGEFAGKLSDVMNFSLNGSGNRGLLVAVMNSVLKYLGLAKGTVHCKDQEPEECSKDLIKWMDDKVENDWKIGLIGLQPSMLENLTQHYGSNRILASDLNPQNIGKVKFGVTILDGNMDNYEIIDKAQFVLLTGSSIINNTFSELYEKLVTENKKFVVFGNTISGIASLVHIPHICFYGR